MDSALKENPSAFTKLLSFMEGDKPRMALSLALACIGEALGIVPYLVIAHLAGGLIEGILTLSSAALAAGTAALAQVVIEIGRASCRERV